MTTIVDYLNKWSKKTPDKIFISEDDKYWTFKTFQDEVLKLSSFFKSKGIKKSACVVVHLEKKSEHLLSYMALLNIGAICVHLYPERECEYVKFAASHCDAKAIISNKFKDNLSEILILNTLEYEECEPLIHGDTGEIAYIMFTSGTTSIPKAVQTTHENLLFVTNTLIDLADMQEQKEREIIFMPLGSTGGLGHFHASLILGNHIRLFPGLYSQTTTQDMENMFCTIEKESITGMLLTPGLILRILQNHKKRFEVVGKNLNYLLANVTPMSRESIIELLELLPNLRFCTYYGSTEASRSIVNVCRENRGYEHFTGKATSNVEIKINNPNKDGEGEIFIKGPNVMKGYLNRGDDGFCDGWFKSDDIGKIDENGFIQILGRLKDTISIDGLKMFPTELENILISYPKIKDVGVCSILDKRTYNQIGLAVVAEEKANKEELTKEIYKILKIKYKLNETDLYSYKIPNKIYFQESIPRTDLGKVRRDDLAQLLLKNNQPYHISKEK